MSINPDPPELSVGPVEPAHVPMDGILHNLARKQRQKAQSSLAPPLEQPQGTPTSILPQSNEGYRTQVSFQDALSLGKSLHSSGEKSLRGILKTPTVRFSGLEPEDVDAVHPLPPPSPPPLDRGSQTSSSIAFEYAELSLQPPPHPPARLPSPPPPPPDEAPRPPSLFDPQVEANKYLSEAAYKLYTRFMDDLSEFVDQQGSVIRYRLKVQEKRQELRQLRERVSLCDMQLLNCIREAMGRGDTPEFTSLQLLFEEAQSARDVVGPVEAEYEPLEISLGAEEHKLREKYAEVEVRFEQFFRLKPSSTTLQSLPSKIEYEASTVSSGSIDQDSNTQSLRNGLHLHGRIIGEQVEIGQIPMAMEEAPSEVMFSGSDARSRRPISELALPSGTTHAHPVEDDEADEADEKSEKTGHIQPGFFVTAEDETSFANIDPGRTLENDAELDYTTLDLIGIQSGCNAPCPHSPRLEGLKSVDRLDQCQDLLVRDAENSADATLSSYLMDFDSTRDRINRWLLYHLRMSRRETYALHRYVLDHTAEPSDWQQLALSEWAKDMLGYDQIYLPGSIESVSRVESLPPSSDPPRLSIMQDAPSRSNE